MKRLELPYRVVESRLPPVQIVDMREELKSGNRGIFSRLLAESLAETIHAASRPSSFSTAAAPPPTSFAAIAGRC